MKRRIPEDTNTFHYYNRNPKDKITNDCVIRSIATATEKTWGEVYNALYEIGLKYGLMPNDPKCYERYLKKLGWVKHKQPRKEDNTKYTGGEFVKTAEYNVIKENSVIAKIGSHHMTVIVNGKIYDTWNCTNNKIGNYWIKE